jgi:hypothetical protein
MTALLPTRTPSEITSILAQILAQSAHAVINHPGEYRQMRRTKTPLMNQLLPLGMSNHAITAYAIATM